MLRLHANMIIMMYHSTVCCTDGLDNNHSQASSRVCGGGRFGMRLADRRRQQNKKTEPNNKRMYTYNTHILRQRRQIVKTYHIHMPGSFNILIMMFPYIFILFFIFLALCLLVNNPPHALSILLTVDAASPIRHSYRR